MAKTFTTKEIFPLNTPTERLDEEVELRKKAGAVNCWYTKESRKWVLYTEWEVIE